MKEFDKKYKKFINSVNLSDNDYQEIKKNILLNNTKKFSFKLKYALLLFLVLFISVFGVVNADKIIKHFNIVTNDGMPFEKSHDKSFISNGVIDKSYPKDLFTENSYYTYNEIEKKLGVHLLKNKYLDSDLFLLHNLKIKKDMIAFAGFTLVNKDKPEINKFKNIRMSLSINTKYSSEPSELNIKGANIYYEEYYIKSLNTEALIVTNSKEFASLVIIEFTYENISYELELDSLNFNDENQVQNIHNILESFSLNI